MKYRMAKLGLLLGLCCGAAIAQQREPVLKQIEVPHNYYFREMYLPQLTSGPSSVAWMPDGKSVVYSMQGSLWRQALDSTVAEQLTSGPGYHYQPDVSPDGQWVVFTAYVNDAMELHSLHLASGRVVQMTHARAVNLEPRFSPDGKRIAFTTTAYKKRFHIYVADFSEGSIVAFQQITQETTTDLPRYYYSKVDHEISPSWSPDGTEILFVSNRGRLYGTGGLWRQKVDPKAEAREIHFEETTWKARPDWSPDGRRVVFSSYQGRPWHQLWVTTPEAGSNPFPISYGDHDNTAARWSRDSKRIAFISNRTGNTSLWIQDAVGGAQRQLVVKSRRYRQQMRALKITVTDALGRQVPARVSVTDAGGLALAPDDVWIHADDHFDRKERPYEAHYFHTSGVTQMMIGLGPVDVEVMRGFDHTVFRARVETDSSSAGGRPVSLAVKLQPLNPPAVSILPERWVSGDVHVHMNYGGAYRNTPENLVRQAQAEGLEVVHNLIVNKEQRIPDIGYFSGKPDAASNARTLLWHAQEFHTSSWGHLGLLGLQKNLLLPDYADYPQTAAASLYPSNDVVADLARAQGGLVGYVHPFDPPTPDPVRDARISHALPMDVALGKVDYLEVVGFSDHHTTASVWYRLLNLGFRIPAAGGTDAMANYASLRGPVGMNRTFVRMAAPSLDPARRMQQWMAGLKAGRTFASNGPLLDFSILGNFRPGDELKMSAGVHSITPTFRARVRSLVALERAEVVCNGKVAAELKFAADGKSADGSGTLTLPGSGWCLLRAYHSKPQHPVLDGYPYATTSPVYVTVTDGTAVKSREDADYFIAWLDRLRQFAAAHTSWNSPEERAHIFNQLAAARAIFEQRR